MNRTASLEALRELEANGSNFVSNQALTCDLLSHVEPDCGWTYATTSSHHVCGGMPRGEDAVLRFEEWSRSHRKLPLIFGCEPQDLEHLQGWQLVELGRQPLFETGDVFRPELCGVEQPASNREMRRQARRASSKQVEIVELDQGQLWETHSNGLLDELLDTRWGRQPLPEFSFLVGLRLGRGADVRRYFIARAQGSDSILGLAITVESGRGYLLEHQMLSQSAPNGTGELLLCKILSQFLPVGRVLSLGITPLYRSLVDAEGAQDYPSILSVVPRRLSQSLLKLWEPLYGFRRLLSFRRKLEPDCWEPVYWAHKGPHLLAVLGVLQAFAGGSLLSFGWRTVVKIWQQFCSRISAGTLRILNTFFVVSLALWIPILWSLDGTQLFGFPEATKVWAMYDVCLLIGFLIHGRLLRQARPRSFGLVLFGLVMADAMLSWLQTAVVHSGLPSSLFLGLFLFVINSAPLAAATFLLVCRGAHFPLSRRDVSVP